MAYSVRGKYTQQEKYSNRQVNQLLDLAKVKIADTLAIEQMLQDSLNRGSDAYKQGSVLSFLGNLTKTIIPGPVDDYVIDAANAVVQDKIRSNAIKNSGIDMSKVSYLKSVAEQADMQAVEATKKMLKDMKAGKILEKTALTAAQGMFKEISNSEAYSKFRESLKLKDYSLLDMVQENMKFLYGEAKSYMSDPSAYQKAVDLYQSTQSPSYQLVLKQLDLLNKKENGI